MNISRDESRSKLLGDWEARGFNSSPELKIRNLSCPPSDPLLCKKMKSERQKEACRGIIKSIRRERNWQKGRERSVEKEREMERKGDKIAGYVQSSRLKRETNAKSDLV